jgi:hypothetical protein
VSTSPTAQPNAAIAEVVRTKRKYVRSGKYAKKNLGRGSSHGSKEALTVHVHGLPAEDIPTAHSHLPQQGT